MSVLSVYAFDDTFSNHISLHSVKFAFGDLASNKDRSSSQEVFLEIDGLRLKLATLLKTKL